MQNDLISIVVPCYNVEKYIEQCIDSILEQSYKNIEIVIVNDGSTDNTLEILRKYSNLSIVKIINQVNSGISISRRNGFLKSNGSMVTFIDSDDFYLNKNVISYMIKKFRYKFDFVGFDFTANYECGKPTVLSLFANKLLRKLKFKKLENDNWSFWGKIYNREYLINAIFPDVRFAEEVLFFSHNRISKYKLFNKKVISYRIRNNSLVRSEDGKAREINKVLSKMDINKFSGWGKYITKKYKITGYNFRNNTLYWLIKNFIFKKR